MSTVKEGLDLQSAINKIRKLYEKLDDLSPLVTKWVVDGKPENEYKRTFDDSLKIVKEIDILQCFIVLGENATSADVDKFYHTSTWQMFMLLGSGHYSRLFLNVQNHQASVLAYASFRRNNQDRVVFWHVDKYDHEMKPNPSILW